MSRYKTTTYWKCECLDDHNAYSIRTKTRKEAIRIKEERERDGLSRFGDPEKVEIDYENRMDLINILLGENTGSY